MAISGVAIIGLYLAQSALSAPPAVIASHMFQRFPPTGTPATLELRDTAIYFAVAGGRGLKTAFCYNRQINQQYYFMAAAWLHRIGALHGDAEIAEQAIGHAAGGFFADDLYARHRQ